MYDDEKWGCDIPLGDFSEEKSIGYAFYGVLVYIL